jgi:hypothetical protein
VAGRRARRARKKHKTNMHSLLSLGSRGLSREVRHVACQYFISIRLDAKKEGPDSLGGACPGLREEIEKSCAAISSGDGLRRRHSDVRLRRWMALHHHQSFDHRRSSVRLCHHHRRN